MTEAYVVDKNLGQPLVVEEGDLPQRNADGEPVVELTDEACGWPCTPTTRRSPSPWAAWRRSAPPWSSSAGSSSRSPRARATACLFCQGCMTELLGPEKVYDAIAKMASRTRSPGSTSGMITRLRLGRGSDVAREGVCDRVYPGVGGGGVWMRGAEARPTLRTKNGNQVPLRSAPGIRNRILRSGQWFLKSPGLSGKLDARHEGAARLT